MTLLARVADARIGAVEVAAIEGEVDASNVGEVGTRVRDLVTNRSVALVVDLTATTYLDSAGINLLFALDAELRERQQRLGLVIAPSSPIARTASISGLTAAVPTHATRAAALAHAA